MAYALVDLGGVLFTRKTAAGSSIDWKLIERLNARMGDDLDKGRISLSDYLHEYNSASGMHLAADAFLGLIFEDHELNLQLLQAVAGKYNVCVASDNYRENINFMRDRFRFDEWAHREYYSYSLGLFKSEPGFFEHVMNDLKCKPDDCLLIDDSLSNIETASALGIRTIHFTGNEQALKELDTF